MNKEYRLTPTQLEHERQIVIHNRRRAVSANTRSTLTPLQWVETLEYFEYKCAYCSHPYRVLEHFVSIRKGGGTTVANCVPACLSCNSIKERADWSGGFLTEDDMQRVKMYLDTRVSEDVLEDEHGPARLIIKEIAERQSITLSQLGRKTRIIDHLLERYWHNTIRSVKLEHLSLIAEVLGVKSGDLLVDSASG